MRAFVIKHAGEYGMSENFDVAVIVQETGAVFFHLVCLSRLGTIDYFYPVHTEKEYKYSIEQTSSLASDSKLASTLCLFLALLLFGLPYLNLWLYLSAYVKKKKYTETDTKQKETVTMVSVLMAYAVAAVVAWQLVKALSNNRQGIVTWVVSVDLDDSPNTNTNYTTEFFEELVAVCSLLVGVHYLKEPKISKVELILKITLLVAALFRAFPGAHLSPHISLYLALMRFVNWESLVFRSLGGFVGFILVLGWKEIWQLEKTPTADGYAAVGEAETAGVAAAAPASAAFGRPGQVDGAGLKITFDGGRYF